MADSRVERQPSFGASERLTATATALRDRGRDWITAGRAPYLIAAAQAVWLGVLLGRGWFSDADLARMADANGRTLNWGYLSNAAGDHFAPADRLIFWLMNRTAGIDWTATVFIRVILAAVATLLLRHLLELLVGPRTWLNLVVLCYAFSPLLVPGLAWLTSGANLAFSQVLILLTVIAHVRYVRSGRVLPAIAVGLSQCLALGFQDQSILTIPMLVLLSLGFLHTGSFQDRVRASVHRWMGWASLIVFVGGFLVLYERGAYNRGASSYSLPSALRIMWQEWTDVLAPAFVAGPWQWTWNANTYVAYADPGAGLVVSGQVAFLVLLVRSIRVTGPRAIVAWLLPVTVACGGVGLAGFGRYDVVKTFIAPLYRYSFTAAVALAVGITLAFARTADAPASSDVVAPRSVHQALAVAVPLFLIASMISSLAFDRRFAANPAETYVNNLVASARAAGPNGNVYDSAVSNSVMPFVEPRHYVSDILGLAGVRVKYDQTASEPLVVHSDGRLGQATFVRRADAAGPTQPNCGVHLGGAGIWTIPLSEALPVQDWFLNLQTFQAKPATLSVSLVDASGAIIRPVSGARVVLAERLDSILLRLPVSAPKAVVLRSTDRSTTVCVVHTYLGGPLPKGGR